MIELLVVISIVALLVGILLPALNQARKAAQRSVDSSNQRQIGVALYANATDNNGSAPRRNAISDFGTPGMNQANLDIGYGMIAGACLSGVTPGNVTRVLGMGSLLGGPGSSAVPDTDGSFGGYIDMDVMFSPADKKASRYGGHWVDIVEEPEDSASFWRLREYFMDGYNSSWYRNNLVHGTQPGGNLHFMSSYAYRGSDYSWYDPDVELLKVLSNQTESLGANTTVWNTPALQAKLVANAERALTDHKDFADNYVLMNHNLGALNQNTLQKGVNAMLGDGSVSYHADDEWVDMMTPAWPYGSGARIGGWYGNGWLDSASEEFALLDYVAGH